MSSKQPSLSPEWSSRTKRTFFLIALVVFGGLVLLIREILPLVIIAALVSFLLNPLVTFISRRVFFLPPLKGNRSLASLIAFVIAILVVVIGLLVIVPVLADQIEAFVDEIPRLLRQAEQVLERILSEPIALGGEPILIDGEPIIPLDRIAEATGTTNLNEVIQLTSLDLGEIAQTFFGSVGTLTGPAFSFVGGAFNTIISLTFLIMMTFYLLVDGGRFVHGFLALAPDGYEADAQRLVKDLGRVWNGYVRGQLILCVVMGMSVYIAATILGVPNAPILGLLAGVLEFIPNIGPFLALIPAAFLGLVSQSSTLPFLEGLPFMLVIIVVWTMLQNVEAIVLVPRIMGDSLDLHPLAVIIGVLSGAAIAGALGIILAAPFLASGRVIARYVYGKLTGRTPFVETRRRRGRDTGLGRAIMRLYRYIRLRLAPTRTGSSDVQAPV